MKTMTGDTKRDRELVERIALQEVGWLVAVELSTPSARVAQGDTRRSIATCALIDTGAFMSAISLDVVEQLGLASERDVRIGGIVGPPQSCSGFSIDLDLRTYYARVATCRDVSVVLADLPYCIIGRDLLRTWVVTWDGPEKMIRITEPSRATLEK